MNKSDLFGKYELFIEEDTDGHPTCPMRIIRYVLIKDGYKPGAIQRCAAPSDKQLENMLPLEYLNRMELSVICEPFALFRNVQENGGV